MNSDQHVTIFKALADKTRLDIVRSLSLQKEAKSCASVSTCATLSQPAMSHHLSKLVDANIIIERKNGKEKYYELNYDLFASIGLDSSFL